jgi:hypothetical protein
MSQFGIFLTALPSNWRTFMAYSPSLREPLFKPTFASVEERTVRDKSPEIPNPEMHCVHFF